MSTNHHERIQYVLKKKTIAAWISADSSRAFLHGRVWENKCFNTLNELDRYVKKRLKNAIKKVIACDNWKTQDLSTFGNLKVALTDRWKFMNLIELGIPEEEALRFFRFKTMRSENPEHATILDELEDAIAGAAEFSKQQSTYAYHKNFWVLPSTAFGTRKSSTDKKVDKTILGKRSGWDVCHLIEMGMTEGEAHYVVGLKTTLSDD